MLKGKIQATDFWLWMLQMAGDEIKGQTLGPISYLCLLSAKNLRLQNQGIPSLRQAFSTGSLCLYLCELNIFRLALKFYVLSVKQKMVVTSHEFGRKQSHDIVPCSAVPHQQSKLSLPS